MNTTIDQISLHLPSLAYTLFVSVIGGEQMRIKITHADALNIINVVNNTQNTMIESVVSDLNKNYVYWTFRTN